MTLKRTINTYFKEHKEDIIGTLQECFTEPLFLEISDKNFNDSHNFFKLGIIGLRHLNIGDFATTKKATLNTFINLMKQDKLYETYLTNYGKTMYILWIEGEMKEIFNYIPKDYHCCYVVNADKSIVLTITKPGFELNITCVIDTPILIMNDILKSIYKSHSIFAIKCVMNYYGYKGAKIKGKYSWQFLQTSIAILDPKGLHYTKEQLEQIYELKI